MDTGQRDSLEKNLYLDREFATLKQPRDQFDYILDKYLVPPLTSSTATPESERDWLRRLIAPTGARLKQWSDVQNHKSYKLAKKHRDSARKVVEIMDKAAAALAAEWEGQDQVKELQAEERTYLGRAEHYLSKAILVAPYVSTVIAPDNDKIARLKVSLFQERAEVRARAGKHAQAVADVAMALHHADHISEHFSGYVDLKITAVKCFAKMGYFGGEGELMEDIIDCVVSLGGRGGGGRFSGTCQQSSSPATPSSTESMDGDQPALPAAYKNGSSGYEMDNDALLKMFSYSAKWQTKIMESLNDMIEYNAHLSNYHADNAPQLVEDSGEHREGYYRYQLATDKIEVRYSPAKGRYFVAREPIEPGTCLLSEKPYSVVVAKDYLTHQCNLCLKTLVKDNPVKDDEEDAGVGYPCDYCKEVRFCSLSCFEEAYQTYHKFECGALGVLLANDQLSVAHVYRILNMVGIIKALDYDRLFKPSSYSVAKFMANDDLRRKSAFELSDADRYTLFRMAATHVEHTGKYSPIMDAYHVMQALDVALVLLNKNEEDLVRTSRAAGRSLRETVLDLLQLCLVSIRRLVVNVFGQYDYGPTKGDKATMATIAPLISVLFNHSCVPNLDWQINAGHIVMKSNRYIEANEELTITYGQTRAHPFQQRQDALSNYHFVCACPLCRSDIAHLDVPVAKCQSCSGPLVASKAGTACLDCGSTSASPEGVRLAVAELVRNYNLLTWYRKMVLATNNPENLPPPPVNINKTTTTTAAAVTDDLKECTLSVMDQIEACLHVLAYTGNRQFVAALHSLADIYLHLREPERALKLARLYEESESKIEQADASLEKLQLPPLKRDSSSSHDTMDNSQLVELNFWTEICFKHFERIMVERQARRPPMATEEEATQQEKEQQQQDDAPLQMTILLYIRFLKQALAYVVERVSAGGRLPELKVGELLDQAQYNDAKLAYLLADKKRQQLIAILGFAKSRCNE